MVIAVNELQGQLIEAVRDLLPREAFRDLPSFRGTNIVIQGRDRNPKHRPLPKVFQKHGTEGTGVAALAARSELLHPFRHTSILQTNLASGAVTFGLEPVFS